MGKKTTKTVKVPESKAEKWDTYVEENPEVDSVSHLIRLSVQKEIGGEYDIEQRRADTDSSSTDGEVLTKLQQIQTGLGDLEQRLTALEETTASESSYDLQKAIYAVLNESLAPKNLPEEDLEHETHDEVLSSRDLAQKLNADIGNVEDTLRRMDDEIGHVIVSEGESGRLYAWKQEDVQV